MSNVDEPFPGYEVALAQAAKVGPVPRLLSIIGIELASNTNPFSTLDDGGPVEIPVDGTVGDGRAAVWQWNFAVAGAGDVVWTSGNRVLGHRATGPSDHAGFELQGLVGPNAIAQRMTEQFPGWLNDTAGVRWVLVVGDGSLIPNWSVASAIPDGLAGAAFQAATLELVTKSVPSSLQAPTLQLSDCTNFGGVFPVPMADATAALPAGFEPVASANDPAGGATLYILFLECEGSSVDGNATGPVNVAYAELAVTPPSEYMLAGITDYTVPLAIGAGNKAVGERLAQFMLGKAGPSTVTDVTDATPGPRKARVVVEGVTLDLTGQFAGEAGTLSDGGFALIGVQDGIVRTVVQAFSQGGSASEGTVTQQSTGLPILEQARPVARGFTVSGFTLSFALVQTV